MRSVLKRRQLWAGLVILVLLAGLRVPNRSAQADLSTDLLNRGVLASAKIWAFDSQKKGIGTCSGTVVDPSGLILTAWHCVGQTDLYGPDDTGLNLKHGDFFNPDGLVAVGFTIDPRKATKPAFFAKVVSGSPDIDIAVVKIVSTLDTKQPLPKTLPLTVMPLADSDKVVIGDPVVLFGYPGTSETITVTNGKVAGFDNLEYNADDPNNPQTKPGGDPNVFKVDGAASFHGNSGGLTTNLNGEQIGIPTAGDQSGVSQERMINYAVPYIKKAQSASVGPGTAPPVQPTPPPQTGPGKTPTPPAGPGKTPTPQPGGGTSFGTIIFGTDGNANGVQNPGTQFPSGTAKISFGMPYQNMRNGASWGYTVRADGDLVIDKHDTESWSSGPNGTYCCIDLTAKSGIPDGSFEAALFIGGKQVQSGTFQVGGAKGTAPQKPQPPAAPAAGNITVTGKVTDADTKRGIPNAVVIILNPGVSPDQFANASDADVDSLVAADATTDSSGAYATAPGLLPGKTYSMVVVADGYVGAAGDGFLKLDKNAKTPYPLSTVSLKKR